MKNLKEKMKMIIIEINGGLVQNVVGSDDYDVLDWDSLLGDCYTTGDTENSWNDLFDATRKYVEKHYPSDFIKIQERIAEDRERAKQ